MDNENQKQASKPICDYQCAHICLNMQVHSKAFYFFLMIILIELVNFKIVTFVGFFT